MAGLCDTLPFYIAAACVGLVWGILDGIVAAGVAGIVGWLLSVLFLKVINHFFNERTKTKLKAMSLDELNEYIKDPDLTELNFVLLEIQSRRENIKKYKSYLIDLLADEQCLRRCNAFMAIHDAFPEELKKYGDYSPYQSAEMCRIKIALTRDKYNLNVQL